MSRFVKPFNETATNMSGKVEPEVSYILFYNITLKSNVHKWVLFSAFNCSMIETQTPASSVRTVNPRTAPAYVSLF